MSVGQTNIGTDGRYPMNRSQFHAFTIIGSKAFTFYTEYIMEAGGCRNTVVCYGRVVCTVACTESPANLSSSGNRSPEISMIKPLLSVNGHTISFISPSFHNLSLMVLSLSLFLDTALVQPATFIAANHSQTESSRTFG